MLKPVTCRYCEEVFTPLPGKPGYINECPTCLYEKTVPPPVGAYDKIIDTVKQNVERSLTQANVSREIIAGALAAIEAAREAPPISPATHS